MSKLVIPILVLLSITGCTTLNARESYVQKPNGERYTVVCQVHGLCKFREGDLELSVDNQGRPGFMEQLIGTSIFGFTGLAGKTTKDLK